MTINMCVSLEYKTVTPEPKELLMVGCCFTFLVEYNGISKSGIYRRTMGKNVRHENLIYIQPCSCVKEVEE